uniref:Uncharacterized protein n=1 Tax=Oryza glaberrima TaxID=4538 RepID=I1Q6S0_ORYGL
WILWRRWLSAMSGSCRSRHTVHSDPRDSERRSKGMLIRLVVTRWAGRTLAGRGRREENGPVQLWAEARNGLKMAQRERRVFI